LCRATAGDSVGEESLCQWTRWEKPQQLLALVSHQLSPGMTAVHQNSPQRHHQNHLPAGQGLNVTSQGPTRGAPGLTNSSPRKPFTRKILQCVKNPQGLYFFFLYTGQISRRLRRHRTPRQVVSGPQGAAAGAAAKPGARGRALRRPRTGAAPRPVTGNPRCRDGAVPPAVTSAPPATIKPPPPPNPIASLPPRARRLTGGLNGGRGLTGGGAPSGGGAPRCRRHGVRGGATGSKMALNRNHSAKGDVVVPNGERYRGRLRGRGGLRGGGRVGGPLLTPWLRGGARRRAVARPGWGGRRPSGPARGRSGGSGRSDRSPPRQRGTGPGQAAGGRRQSCPVLRAAARRSRGLSLRR